MTLTAIELLASIGFTVLSAILVLLIIFILVWFHDVNDVKNLVKDLEEDIDFEKLVKVYKRK